MGTAVNPASRFLCVQESSDLSLGLLQGDALRISHLPKLPRI